MFPENAESIYIINDITICIIMYKQYIKETLSIQFI